jgi:hypothetical protein
LLKSLQAGQEFREDFLFFSQIGAQDDFLLAEFQDAFFGSGDRGFLGLDCLGNGNEPVGDLLLILDRGGNLGFYFFKAGSRRGDFLLDGAEFIFLGQRGLGDATESVLSSRRKKFISAVCYTGRTCLKYGSGSVVGMIYHNGDRPVNLFKKHNAHQPVGPGHFTKRDKLSGALSGCSTVAVGAADQERKVLGALVEVALQELGKGFAGHGFSAFIEPEGEGLGPESRSQNFGFFILALAGGLALGFSEIGHR